MPFEATHESLPVAPSMEPALQAPDGAPRLPHLRSLRLCALAVALGVVAALVAELLTALIGFFTNLAFYQRVSFELVDPAGTALGPALIFVPIVGGLLVGLMARYGSSAIRGHGIPEAMEQVLFNESRIPARVTLLKPVSAAVTIGTGGPFGAEGPIIATGGSLGSLLGQLLRTTAGERKVLLAAGAAGGMAATFGTPVAAVLLAVELLLFELRASSLIPVSLAAATAASVRVWHFGTDPVFAMPAVPPADGGAIAGYFALGLVAGVAAVGLTRVVYWIEDGFERLPVHWMWWPAIGAIAVGVVGYFAPATLGVGYSNIEDIVSGRMALGAAMVLCSMKLVSWAIALGSGTSGGTLAPMFTIGGGIGLLVGVGLNAAVPALHVDLRVAALVGMAATFAGASRAFLASVVFAFETTHHVEALLPLLIGCAASYLVGLSMMRNSIMTEKIARRGSRVPSEYTSDYLDQRLVRDHATREVSTVDGADRVGAVCARLSDGTLAHGHQGFPVLDDDGALCGVITRRDILRAEGADAPVASLVRRSPVTIFEDQSLRDAADTMVRAGVGRLPVVARGAPHQVRGILSRSDILAAHAQRLRERDDAVRSIDPWSWLGRRGA